MPTDPIFHERRARALALVVVAMSVFVLAPRAASFTAAPASDTSLFTLASDGDDDDGYRYADRRDRRYDRRDQRQDRRYDRRDRRQDRRAERRPQRPSQRHVWVPGQYTYNRYTRRNVWVSGHWARRGGSRH